MASPSQDLQAAVYGLLSGAATLTALVGTRIYDGVPPKDAAYPRITFGPADYVPEQLDGCYAQIEAVQIDVWSRQNGQLFEAKGIVDLVRRLLNGASLSLATHAAASCEVTLVRVFRDADELTAHGVVQLEVMLEDLS